MNSIKNSNYKIYRNLINKLIVKAKEHFHLNKLDQANGNIKEVWKIANEASGNNKQHKSINKLVNNENTILTKPKDIANEFNSVFYKYWKQVS